MGVERLASRCRGWICQHGKFTYRRFPLKYPCLLTTSKDLKDFKSLLLLDTDWWWWIKKVFGFEDKSVTTAIDWSFMAVEMFRKRGRQGGAAASGFCKTSQSRHGCYCSQLWRLWTSPADISSVSWYSESETKVKKSRVQIEDQGQSLGKEPSGFPTHRNVVVMCLVSVLNSLTIGNNDYGDSVYRSRRQFLLLRREREFLSFNLVFREFQFNTLRWEQEFLKFQWQWRWWRRWWRCWRCLGGSVRHPG